MMKVHDVLIHTSSYRKRRGYNYLNLHPHLKMCRAGRKQLVTEKAFLQKPTKALRHMKDCKKVCSLRSRYSSPDVHIHTQKTTHVQPIKINTQLHMVQLIKITHSQNKTDDNPHYIKW
jgi:hypothetical protein